MDLITNLIDAFRDLFAQVPDLLQPLVIASAGAIPFVEGEIAAGLGIIGGLHPAIAVVAAFLGNFICVAVLVLTGASARETVVERQRTRRPRSQADADLDFAVDLAVDPVEGLAMDLVAPEEDGSDRKAARRARFQRSFERYGVPGVSLLGPLLLPTQFTATMLVAAGIGRGRILFWQALSIIGWTVLVGLILTGVTTVAG